MPCRFAFAMLLVAAVDAAHATDDLRQAVAYQSCDYIADHAIEAEFGRAILASGGVTVDMRDAQSAAYQAWDAELNRLYAELLASLPDASDREALRKSQRAWLKFVDADVAWLHRDAMHGQTGTSGPLNIAGHSLVTLQRRICDMHYALELRAMYAP